MKPKTLDKLKELFQAASPDKRTFTVKAEPACVYYTVRADGTLDRVEAMPQPIEHKAADLETLVRWTAEPFVDDVTEPRDLSIFYTRRRIVGGVAACGPTEDRCIINLEPSPQLAYLRDNEGRKGDTITQTDLIRLLRTTLAGCWSGDLLTNIRKLQIAKAKQVQSEQVKGKVSLNRSDIAEMSGAADLPDEVVFDVPIFAAGSITARATVRAVLELNPETERFGLIVLPGQTEAAFTRGEVWLAATITELLGEKAATIPVYHAEP